MYGKGELKNEEFTWIRMKIRTFMDKNQNQWTEGMDEAQEQG